MTDITVDKADPMTDIIVIMVAPMTVIIVDTVNPITEVIASEADPMTGIIVIMVRHPQARSSSSSSSRDREVIVCILVRAVLLDRRIPAGVFCSLRSILVEYFHLMRLTNLLHVEGYDSISTC
jgi:hypothetical protein